MLIKLLFTCAIVFALLTFAFPADSGIHFVAVAAACVAAVLAAVRSIGEDRYFWFAGFTAIAVLLSPIGAVSLTRVPTLAILGVCFAVLASWMVMLRRSKPTQSIAHVLYPRDAR